MNESIPKVCFTLIILALLLFFYSFYHNRYMAIDTHTLSIFITNITSFFSTTTSPSTPTFEGGSGFSIYESRAVLIMFCVSIIMLVTSLLIGTWFRVYRGVTQLYLQLTFLSACTMGCVIYVGIHIGLPAYA